MDKIYIIAGPTASGKTSTAIEVAKLINGEIICADSMQIYKYMDIGTAKVKQEEMQEIPHYLYDIVTPDTEFSVADYVKMDKEKIADIINRGKKPIIVGGTGLYIESLIYGYDLGGAKTDDNIKKRLFDELANYGAEYMHNKLREVDPVDADKIHKNNTKRLIRALEIYELTGQTKSKTNTQDKKPIYDVDLNILDFPREELYKRINQRVDIMFNEGLVNEVLNLTNLGYDFSLQSMQAIGYKEFSGFTVDELKSDATISNLKELIAKNTRHYAKRQITWFKRYAFAECLSPSNCIKKYIALCKNIKE